MNYIINPIWFYLMDLLSKAEIIAIVIAVISFGCAGIFFIVVGDTYATEEDKLKFIRLTRNALIVSLIAGALYIIFPSKSACKEMMVASLITEENLSYTKEEAKDFVDYIFEKIEEMQDEDSD